MVEDVVTITVKEYKELVFSLAEAMTRMRVFANYVNGEKYPIDRGMCGKFLGFEVDKDEVKNEGV